MLIYRLYTIQPIIKSDEQKVMKSQCKAKRRASKAAAVRIISNMSLTEASLARQHRRISGALNLKFSMRAFTARDNPLPTDGRDATEIATMEMLRRGDFVENLVRCPDD